MTLPTVFAGLAAGNYPASLLDGNYNAVGNMATYRCTATGTNSIALAVNANQTPVTAYANNLSFWFVAAATSTASPVTIQVNALAALDVYRQDSVLAGSGDIVVGESYEAFYVSTLNGGVGGFILMQPPVATAPAWSSIAGFIPSSIAGTSTTATLTVSAGQATDGTNTSYITKNSTTAWAVTNGNLANGYQGGITLPNSQTIDFYAISGASGQGVFAVQNGTALVLPTGYTLSRFIFSLTTTAGGAPNQDTFNEINGGGLQVYLVAQTFTGFNSTTTATLQALTGVPLGRKREGHFKAIMTTAAYQGTLFTSPDEVAVSPSVGGSGGFNGTAPGFNTNSTSTNSAPFAASLRRITNTFSQIRHQSNATSAIQLVTEGYIDFRRT